MQNLISFVEDDESPFEHFPELAGKRLVKIASALSMSKEVVDYLTAHRCYALMLGDETMDLVNFHQIADTACSTPPMPRREELC